MQTVMDVWSPANPPRILHLGAHLGEERDAYEAAGTEVVWWVEGNPELLDPLRAHLCEPRAIARTQHQVIHAVLGQRDGEPTVLNIAADTMNSSVLGPGTIPVDYVAAHQARSAKVDSIMGDLGQPTMVNSDLQGIDLAVLKGAGATLAGVEIVYVEVAEDEIYRGAPHWSKVDAFLREAGFRLALTEMDRNNAGWGDSLYRREGIG